MYALRERRQHVTQEDFEFAVAKVRANSICHCNALTAFDG
jgi:ATP-dependent 26S proteasome regulatory subunit